jgi:tape measure domain-containing protein
MSQNDIEVRIGARTDGLQDGMARANRVIAESMSNIQRQFEGFGVMMRGIKSIASGAALAVVATVMVDLGKQVIEAMSSFEQLQIRLDSVMGSAAKGQEAFGWIQKFAKETPYQVSEVTQSFMLLKNMGLDPMDGSLKAIADQAAKTGGGFETLQRISLALGQAWTKGKLQGEEAMQLLEAGVPVWDMLAKVTGKTTAEIQALSEKGALGRNVIKALIDEIGRSADGAAVAQMQSLSGQFSNLADNAQHAFNELRMAGGLAPLKQAVASLNNEFDRLHADGSINRWAQNIAGAMQVIANATHEALGAVSDAATLIAGDIADTTTSITGDVDGVTVASQTMATVVAEASYFVQTVWTSFAGVARDIQAVIVTVWEGISLAVAIAKETIYRHIEVLIGWLRTLGNVASAVLKGDFSGASAAWDTGMQQIEQVVAKRAANIVKLATDANKAIADVWKTSGVMTTGGQLDNIQKQLDQRIQRLHAPKASYSNEGRGSAHADSGKPAAAKTPRLTVTGGKTTLSKGPRQGNAEASRFGAWQTELDNQRLDAESSGSQQSQQQEAEFWAQKLAIAKPRSQEYEQVLRQHQRVKLAMARDGAKNAHELALAEIDIQTRANNDALAADEAAWQREAALQGLSHSQQEATLIGFEQRRLAIQKAAIDARIAEMERDPDHNIAEKRRLDASLEEAEREHLAKLADIRGQSQTESMDPATQRWNGIEGDTGQLYQQGLERMLQGTLSFKQAVQQVWGEIGRIMLQHLVLRPAVEMAAKYTRELEQEGVHQAAMYAIKQGWLSRELAMKMGLLNREAVQATATETAKTAAVIGGEATRTGAVAAASGSTIGIKGVEATAVVGANAAEAASGAAASVASIPYVGWAMAAGVFAATMAMVLGAKSSIKSASGGYSIPRGLNPITQLHEEEMVLPRPYANAIRDMAAGRSGEATASPPAGDSYAVHYNDNSGRLSREQIRDNARTIAEELNRLHRHNWKPA